MFSGIGMADAGAGFSASGWLGAAIVAADPDFVVEDTGTNSQVSNLGPVGAVGFGVMAVGTTTALFLPGAIIGGVDGSDGGFTRCANEAAKAGAEPR